MQGEGTEEAASEHCVVRRSGGDAGGSGVWSWERRGSTFTLHPFSLSKPSCCTLDLSKIIRVMREKKTQKHFKHGTSVLHTARSFQLGQEGTRGSHIPISPTALSRGSASPNWAMGAVGKTSSVNL